MSATDTKLPPALATRSMAEPVDQRAPEAIQLRDAQNLRRATLLPSEGLKQQRPISPAPALVELLKDRSYPVPMQAGVALDLIALNLR